MKNLNDLKIERQEKVDAMANIVETRADSMDDVALATIKSLKADIVGIDAKVEAVNELRSVAIEGAKPADTKNVDSKKELRANFNDMIRGKLTQSEFEKRTVMSGTPGAAAELVPEEFLKALQEKMEMNQGISQKAKKFTTTDNGQITIPVIDDTATIGVWTAEGGTITPEDFASSVITMDAYKVATGISMSTEFLEDAFFNVESYLSGALAERISKTLESSYLWGTGVGQPLGITVGAQDSVVKIDSAVADTVTIADLQVMPQELKNRGTFGAEYLVSFELFNSLLLEVDGNGRPLLQAAQGATPADPIKYTINGYPVTMTNHLSAVSGGDISVIFGNFSDYWIRNVRNITLKRDDYSSMANDLVNFYMTFRCDGKVVNANKAFVCLTTLA